MAGGVAVFLTLILSSLLVQLAASSHHSPFGFAKQLQGCQKGDKVEGIHKVKMYLQRFGYMSPTSYQTEEASDDFDDELESAIKDFQTFYQLEASGMLDGPTASLMSRPRCGVPDDPKAARRGHGHNHSHSHLNIGTHYAFFEGEPKWPPEQRNLPYYIPDNPHPEAADAVGKAFQAWAAVSSFTFQRVADPGNARISVSFQVRDHGDGLPFDGVGGALAHAFRPTDGRLHFDDDDEWAIGAVPTAFHIQTIATHEIGHLLGLAHSQSNQAIMYGFIDPGVVKVIVQDDIDGITDLYN